MKTKPANFYIKATMCCPDCLHREDVLINRDLEVFHECNEGNVRAIVPTLEIPVPTEPTPIPQPLLLKGKNSSRSR